MVEYESLSESSTRLLERDKPLAILYKYERMHP